jgi:hypothetical protein
MLYSIIVYTLIDVKYFCIPYYTPYTFRVSDADRCRE